MKTIYSLLILIAMVLSTKASAQEKSEEKNRVRKEYVPFINDLLSGGYLPFIVNTTAGMGFFEVLEEGALAVPDIVSRLKTKEIVTEACLEVLRAARLLSLDDGKYALTSNASKYLLKSSPLNQLEQLNNNNLKVSSPLANLKDALLGEQVKIESGGKAGNGLSQWQDKKQLVAMRNRIKTHLGSTVSFVQSLPEFSKCRKMMDFAGSIGYYSFGILDVNPYLKVYVYDLPQVCDIAVEVQKGEKNFDRISFHGFDMRKEDAFGDGYDLFFVSNALYGQRLKGQLISFFKKANRAMVKGGVLVSNHWTTIISNEGAVGATISDLISSFHGRPVHSIDKNVLEEALKEAGFDNFTIELSDQETAKPVLLLAARKVRNV